MTATWALITGLVREEALLREKIQQLDAFRSKGIIQGIAFSTWLDEIDKYQGLRQHLIQSGVKLVESSEPGVKLGAHLLHQNKALTFGLDAIPKKSFVFKLRTDLTNITNQISDAITKRDDLEIEPLAGWPHIFSKRILVNGGILTQPLFLNDIFYAGIREDLQELAGHSFVFESYNLLLNLEQMVFGTPFLTLLPQFFEWFRINYGLIHKDQEHARAVHSFALSEDFFLECMALYFIVLRQYFRVGFNDRSQKFKQEGLAKVTQLTYSQFFSWEDSAQLPGFIFHNLSNSTVFSSDYWVEPILDGQLKVDQLGERFLACVQKVKNPDYQANFACTSLQLSNQTLEFAKRLKEKFPQTNFRLSDIMPDDLGNWRIEGRVSSAKLSGSAR